MSRILKTSVSLLIALSMLLSCCVVSFAEETTPVAETFTYDFSVSERNGVKLEHHMVKRGMPLVEGQVMPDDNFVAVDKATGETFPVYTKSLVKHDDGSVSWLLVSFFLDLEPNEKRDFVLKKVDKTVFDGEDIKIVEGDSSITVSNGIVSIEVDKAGLKNLVYKGKSFLTGNGSNTFYSVQEGDRISGVGQEVEVYENTPNYVTIKTRSSFNGGMTSEQLFTVYRNSNRIGNQHRFTLTDGERSGYIFVDSVGQEFLLASDFASYTNAGVDYVQVSDGVTLSRGSGASAYSADKDVTFSIVSRDPNKFAGVAGNLGVVNGFVTDKNNKTLTFSPLVYRTGGPAFYKWYDGIGRTFHSDIIITDGSAGVDFDDEFINLDNPPYVHVDPQRYVDTGWLGSTETMSVMDRNHQAMLDLYKDVRLGRLDTGSVTYESAATGMIKGIAQRPAKLEYHSWHGQMTRDDADYFDIIAESCETYADINIYRGNNKAHWGAGRYRTYFDDRMQFENWQCYYTSPDGMYLGYLMTGNEYLKDTIKLHYDYALTVSLIAKDMIANTEQKYGKAKVERGQYEEAKPIEDGFQILGETLYYHDNNDIGVISTSATRFAVHTRSAYFVYKLFEDPKYLGISKGYVDWLDYYQMDNGRLSSGYWFNGSPTLYNSDPNLITTSNYILLYGIRAVNDLFRTVDPEAEFYDYVDREKMRNVLVGLADWFIEDMTPAGELWTMSDPDTAAIDGGRGESGPIAAYGAEILYTAYNETKDIKYLEAFCKMQRADKYALESDGFAGEVHAEPYKLVQMGTFYIPWMRENEKLIRELGYGDLVDIYLNGVDMVDGEFKALNPNTPVSGNIWTNGDSRFIYMAYSNNGGVDAYYAGAGNSSVGTDYVANINTGDNYIYEGVEQIVPTDKTTVLLPSFMPYSVIDGKDNLHAFKTDLKVLPGSSDVKAEVIENKDDQLVILLQAENGLVNLALEDADTNYSVDVKYQSFRNSRIVTIKKGGDLAPVDGVINFTVDFTDGDPEYTLPEVTIDERVPQIVPVVTDEEGYRPAWMPYSPIEGSYLIKPTGNKGTFTFTAKPLDNSFGTTIFFCSNENNVGAQNAFQIALYFETDKKICAIDYNSKKSVDELSYELGKEYDFKVDVDVEARTYSAWVTDEEGNTYTIADNYKFRGESAAATTLDCMTLIGHPKSLIVTNHSLAK